MQMQVPRAHGRRHRRWASPSWGQQKERRQGERTANERHPRVEQRPLLLLELGHVVAGDHPANTHRQGQLVLCRHPRALGWPVQRAQQVRLEGYKRREKLQPHQAAPPGGPRRAHLMKVLWKSLLPAGERGRATICVFAYPSQAEEGASITPSTQFLSIQPTVEGKVVDQPGRAGDQQAGPVVAQDDAVLRGVTPARRGYLGSGVAGWGE